MKILRISLRNIASLAGEHTVDFTKEPLAHAGLFSISGPTGSGKSTLLDALCLALYHNTPRMVAAAGTVAMADANRELNQYDVRTLLRRGCGEGFAEVAFVGVDGCTYTARWEARRAQAKADRALQKTQHFLWKGNAPHGTASTEAAAGTPTEIRRQIETKVGLSFDQFRRAVLLAQGDFATFLKARDADRAEILQALTGTERFEKISTAIYERTKREETAVQALRDQIGAAPPLSVEARSEADLELARAEAFHTELQNTLATRGKQLEWFRVEAEHRKRLADTSDAVSRWSQRVSENEPKARELQWVRTASIQAGPKRAAEKQAHAAREEALQRLAELRERDVALKKEALAVEERHKQAAQGLERASQRRVELASELERARALDVEILQLEQAASLAHREHVRAQETFQKAEKELANLTNALAKLEKNKRQLESSLQDVAPFEPFAKEMAMWMDRFDLERRLRTKKDQLAKRVSHAAKKTDAAAAHLEKARTALPSLREAREKAEDSFNQATKSAAAFDPELLLAQRRNATTLQDELQKVKMHLAEQMRLLGQIQALEGSLQTLQAQINQENQLQQTLLEKSIPEAETLLAQASQSLRIAETAASTHTAILRQALVQGEACLVCGSREHPHAAIPVTHESAVLMALEGEVDLRNRALSALRTDLAAAGARSQEKTQQDKKLRQDLERLEKQAAVIAAYKPDLEQIAAMLRKPPAQRDAELAQQEADTVAILDVLEQQADQRIRAEQHLHTARELFDKASHALQKAEKEEGDARNIHSSSQSEHANACSEWNAAVDEHTAAFEVIHPVVSALTASAGHFSIPEFSPSELDYAADPEVFCRWFEVGTAQHQSLTQQLEQVRREAAGSLGLLEKLREAATAAREAVASREATQDEARKNLEIRKAGRQALLGGRSVAAAEQEDSAAYDAAVAAERRAVKEHADLQSKRNAQLESLEQQQKLVLSREAAWCDARDAVEAWLSDFHAREGQAIDRLRLDAWLNRDAHVIEREQQELDAARQQLSEAKGVEAVVRQQLETHQGTRSTPDDPETIEGHLRRLTAEVKTAQDAAHAKRAIVLGDEERRKRVGELAKNLETRIKQADPWQKLNHLIGSADGARFRNIAQQWTLEILLRHANAQLALLSGRYRLERLRDSLNLLVTDLEMDGQQRSVHSLSGGESFLISLGLALGLASLTSSRLRIESLFIDEGFGSLDSETLRVALNALSHLESQGRKVGVISHVSEMVDAIPVQVRVVRGQGGASKIVV